MDGEPQDWALPASFGFSIHVLTGVYLQGDKEVENQIQTADECPKYKDAAAMSEAKKRCRIVYRKFRNLDFVIDVDKYFGLLGFQMSGNIGYYTSDFSQTPMAVNTHGKKGR